MLCSEGGSSFVRLQWTMHVICATALLKQEETIIEGRKDLRMNHHLFTLQKAVFYRLVSSCSDLSFITEMHRTFVNALGGKKAN